MAHFVRTQSNGTWDGPSYVTLVSDWQDLDYKVFAAINGDHGGCWAPSAPIVIGGGGGGVAAESMAWGSNARGACLNGNTSPQLSPGPVTSINNIDSTSSGFDHTLICKTDGTVWAIGLNDRGQLGDGTQTNRTTPVQVPGITTAIAVAAGESFSLALLANGNVLSWGDGSYGQGGDGLPAPYWAFRTILTPQTVTISSVEKIAVGRINAFAILADGSVWGWGGGSIGDGSAPGPAHTTPGAVSVPNSVDVDSATGQDADGGIVATTSGAVYVWGDNHYGQLGNGTTDTTQHYTPVVVSGLTNVIAVAAGAQSMYALKSDGTVWAWGRNDGAQLGNGSFFDAHTPVQITTLSGITAIDAFSTNVRALKLDGTVWAWGGYPGDGTISGTTVPSEVSGVTSIIKINTGHVTSIAISDGSSGGGGAVRDLHLMGPLGVNYGGSLTTEEGARFILTQTEWPQLASYHVGRTRTIVTPCRDRQAGPREWLWINERDTGSIRSIACTVRHNATVQYQPAFSLPLRVHDGARLTSATITFQIPVPREAPPIATPRIKIVRVNSAGVAESLLDEATVDSEGYMSFTKPATGGEWYFDGISQSFTLTCSQNNVIDTSQYSYYVQLIEELGVNPSPYPLPPNTADGSIHRELKVDVKYVVLPGTEYEWSTPGRDLTISGEPGGSNDDLHIPPLPVGLTLLIGDRVLVLRALTFNPFITRGGIFNITEVGTTSDGTWARSGDAQTQEQFTPGFLIADAFTNQIWEYTGAPGVLDDHPVGHLSVYFRRRRARGNIYHAVSCTFDSISDMRPQ